jgi:hypothetical protein
METLYRATNGNSALGYTWKHCTELQMEILYMTTHGNPALGYT